MSAPSYSESKIVDTIFSEWFSWLGPTKMKMFFSMISNTFAYFIIWGAVFPWANTSSNGLTTTPRVEGLIHPSSSLIIQNM